MSVIFCGHDGAPGHIKYPPTTGRSGSNADSDLLAELSISVWMLSACRRHILYRPRGAAQIMDFIVKIAGPLYWTVALWSFLLPALLHSVRFHVDPERGELTVARNPTLAK